MTKKENASTIYSELNNLYDAVCTLNYKNALELLVATMLAAQCTDVRVNIVTPALFAKYKTAEDYANASVSDIIEYIHSTGFYHNKAKNIISCCKRLVEVYNGEVPDSIAELITLDGVGRKTASVVVGEIWGKPAIVVDTHAGRLARRMGFTKNTDPKKIEEDLRKILPSDISFKFCHLLVHHGRAVCHSRKPKCDACPIEHLCKKIL